MGSQEVAWFGRLIDPISEEEVGFFAYPLFQMVILDLCRYVNIMLVEEVIILKLYQHLTWYLPEHICD